MRVPQVGHILCPGITKTFNFKRIRKLGGQWSIGRLSPVIAVAFLAVPVSHVDDLTKRGPQCLTRDELLPKFQQTFEKVYWVDSGFLHDYTVANRDIAQSTGSYAAHVPPELGLADYAILYRAKGAQIWHFTFFRSEDCVLRNWAIADWRHQMILEKLTSKNRA